ncbi:MAG: hypothetical protein AAFP03_07910 [Cyanobacteria bacterium J06598_3]
MTTVLIISFSDLTRDPRVSRQISFLKDNYELITIGFGQPTEPSVKHFPAVETLPEAIAHAAADASQPSRIVKYRKGIARRYRRVKGGVKRRYTRIKPSAELLLRRYEHHYWQKAEIIRALSLMANMTFDVVIANDIDALPLALKGAKGKKVIFDAHEYAPLELENKLSFRLFRQGFVTYLCNQYVPKADGMMTVCDAIAERFKNTTGKESLIITNAPDYLEAPPRLVDGEGQKIKLIHHGGASPLRKLEKMIEMMAYLDEGRFELHLMLVEGSRPYIEELKALAKVRNDVFFHDPVPMPEIASFINQHFDVGVYILEPNCFNNIYALPNKFFEFVQGKLAIAIAPSPEMARRVADYDLGVVADDFTPQALATELNKLDQQQINRYKKNAYEASQQLSANNNQPKVLALVEQVLASQ